MTSDKNIFYYIGGMPVELSVIVISVVRKACPLHRSIRCFIGETTRVVGIDINDTVTVELAIEDLLKHSRNIISFHKIPLLVNSDLLDIIKYSLVKRLEVGF